MGMNPWLKRRSAQEAAENVPDGIVPVDTSLPETLSLSEALRYLRLKTMPTFFLSYVLESVPGTRPARYTRHSVCRAKWAYRLGTLGYGEDGRKRFGVGSRV